ncbi:MAG: LemA family protein, partial [Ketobacteraceae bacterium]|nr:LemA family protein [Ketobacteraceae bacterium]
RVLRNWANIDVLLQKRFDLFRNLQSVVDRSMDYEKELLTLISDARALDRPATGDTRELAQTLAGQDRLNQRLMAIREDYPQLKASEPVSRFMAIMADTETDISLVRGGYNDAVETYNARIQSFPDVILAKLFRFDVAEFGHWDPV